jgi:hypothetical protein
MDTKAEAQSSRTASDNEVASATVTPAYRVEAESTPCAHCGNGGTWNVVGPDDMALGIIFTVQEDADDVAEQMNIAFDAGRQSSDLLAALREARACLVIEGYVGRGAMTEHAVITQIDAALAKAEGK